MLNTMRRHSASMTGAKSPLPTPVTDPTAGAQVGATCAGSHQVMLKQPALARWGVFGVVAGELLFPHHRGRLQQAHAAVPARDGIGVAGGTDFFRFAEAVQRTFEKRIYNVR